MKNHFNQISAVQQLLAVVIKVLMHESKRLVFYTCVALIFTTALSANPDWYLNGRRAPVSDDRGSVDGFGDSIVFTSDRDWLKRWNVPPEQTPSFVHADKVKVGQRGTLLIFFANPKQVDGKIDVRFDVKTIRPNGDIRECKKILGCSGVVRGPVTATFLAQGVIEYDAQRDDPKGMWQVTVVVHDNLRKVSVPVKTSFEMIP